MNANVGRAEIGQWYARSDKGESFRVVGYDEHAGTIEIQSFDGDVDEIDEETWDTLPLERIEPPEDWTGPVDDVEVDDLGYSETEMRRSDWTEPLQPARVGEERREESGPEEE
jgi:hypothetical protein